MGIASLIKGYLGLPYKPVDIDADAAAVLNSATQAVQVVLDRRAAMDKAGLQKTPLIVVKGEVHSMPAHFVHHMLMIDRLVRQEDIAVACEQEHNIFSAVSEFTFIDNSSSSSSEQGPERLKDLDREHKGQISLAFKLATQRRSSAHLSSQAFYRTLLRGTIPTQFVDTACSGENFDHRDPSTARSMESCLGSIKSDIVRHGNANGIHVRNHHMAEMGLAFARETEARILISQCGDAHVLGYAGLCDWKESLSAEFLRRAQSVIAIPILGGVFQYEDIPADHGLDAENLVLCERVPDTDAIYDTLLDRPAWRKSAEIRSAAAEVGYLNSLLERVGLESEVSSLKEWRDFEKNFKVVIKTPSPAMT